MIDKYINCSSQQKQINNRNNKHGGVLEVTAEQ